MELAGLFPLSHYVCKRQWTLEDTIATRPVLGLCIEATRLSGSPRRLWWREGLIESSDEAEKEEDTSSLSS